MRDGMEQFFCDEYHFSLELLKLLIAEITLIVTDNGCGNAMDCKRFSIVVLEVTTLLR